MIAGLVDTVRAEANREFKRLKADHDAIHMLCDLVDFLHRNQIEHALERGADGAVTLRLSNILPFSATNRTPAEVPPSLPRAVQSPDAAASAKGGASGGDLSETTAPGFSVVSPGAVQSPDVRADIPPGGPSGGAFKTGPYTPAEIDHAAQLIAAGKSKVQIAEALNRDVRGINAVMSRAQARAAKLVLQGIKPYTPGPRQAVAERPSPAPANPDASPQPRSARAPRPPEPGDAATSPAPLSMPSEARRDPRDAGKFGIRYELAIWLDTCGNPDPWTPAKDLALAECIIRGDGIPGAAMEIQIPSDDCRARWFKLTRVITGEKGLTLDGQAALMAELRERAG